jgi:hypothetical protein
VYCNYGGVIDSSKYFTVVTHQLRMKFQSIFNDYLEKERNLENNIQTR